MSTDPLGDAIGRSEPAQPAYPPPDGAPPGPPAGEPAPQAAYAPPSAAVPAGGHQAPPVPEPAPDEPAWTGPEAERPLLERRPEILVGAALAGGFVAAQLLGRIRGR